MESVVLLREAGISASPLVSRGRRIERLDEFFDHDDSMLLDHSASKYLETACIMDGLSSSDPEASGPRRAARTHARTGTCAHRRPWPASP